MRSKSKGLVAALAVVGSALAAPAVVPDSAEAATTTGINSGSWTSVATGGVTYSRDKYYSGGYASTASPVRGTVDASVYRTVRVGVHGYSIPVTCGDHRVTLRTIEHYWNRAGARVFDVSAEERMVLPALDVFAASGGKNRALDRTFDVRVSDGRLDLNFKAVRDLPIIAAVSITTLTACSPVTDTPPRPVASAEVGLPLNGWTNRLADDAPLEDDSALNGTAGGGTPYADRFANMAKYHAGSTPVAGYYGFGYNTIISTGAAPVYVVRDANHPTQKVTWMTNNGAGPEAELDWAAGLQRSFMNVPVPQGPNGERFEDYYGRSLDAAGGDKQLVIYKPDTGEMWEMWLFGWSPERGRYEMGYGGYSPNIRTAPIALPHNWGARATSLPLAAGIMLQSEYAAGEFKHPLTVAIPVVKPGWIAPATREDGNITWHTVGNDGRDAVPEGAWFRLPASYPIDPTKPKLWQMMVKAARDYGIVVADGTGGSMTFSVEAPSAIGTPYSNLKEPAFPSESMDNVYWGSRNVLNTFPWDDLVQVAYRP